MLFIFVTFQDFFRQWTVKSWGAYLKNGEVLAAGRVGNVEKPLPPAVHHCSQAEIKILSMYGAANMQRGEIAERWRTSDCDAATREFESVTNPPDSQLFQLP